MISKKKQQMPTKMVNSCAVSDHDRVIDFFYLYNNKCMEQQQQQ